MQTNPPIVKFHPDFKEYDDTTEKAFEHEAGFDAFMTGSSFMRCVNVIRNGKNDGT